mmetsp:Transcript_29725/g.41068  ORF Transcript_29725/g.41068 Transcript_29725/m.41068 type:complete len:120 (-) Transcript_29725:61-420(-)
MAALPNIQKRGVLRMPLKIPLSGPQNWEERRVALTEDGCLRVSRKRRSGLVEEIELDGVEKRDRWDESADFSPEYFFVTTKFGRDFIFRAKDEIDRDEWVEAIQLSLSSGFAPKPAKKL